MLTLLKHAHIHWANEIAMTLQDAYTAIREHLDETMDAGDFRVTISVAEEICDQHTCRTYGESFTETGWVAVSSSDEGFVVDGAVVPNDQVGESDDESHNPPHRSDRGLTWTHGDPWLTRTVDFTVDCSFHNDVEIYIRSSMHTNLRTGETVRDRYVSESDQYNFGADQWPALVELFFHLAENLL